MFSTLDGVLTLQGESITQAKTRDLIRYVAADKSYFIKRYWTSGKRLRRYMLRSRARAEWENIQFFHTLQIPAPHIIAYGEARKGVRYEGGAFIMEALPPVQPLDVLLAEGILSPLQKRNVLKQVALGMSVLHAHRFVHGDCFVRNFLIGTDDQRVYFTDCPRGRFMWGPFLTYHKRRDLRSFYMGAKSWLSRTEMLRMYLTYCRQHQNVN